MTIIRVISNLYQKYQNYKFEKIFRDTRSTIAADVILIISGDM